MNASDYQLGLLAIISGLAITHLLTNATRLLMDRRHTDWDWLPIASAIFVAYLIVYSWFVTGRAWQKLPNGISLGLFVLTLIEVAPFYIAARAVLPDDRITTVGSNLRSHYEENSRLIWGAIAISAIITNIDVAVSPFSQGAQEAIAPLGYLPNVIFIAAIGSLAFTTRRWVHLVTVPVLLGALVFSSIGLSL